MNDTKMINRELRKITKAQAAEIKQLRIDLDNAMNCYAEAIEVRKADSVRTGKLKEELKCVKEAIDEGSLLFYRQKCKIEQQAEQITALKEKNCELAHTMGQMTDDINEQERHTKETQDEIGKLKYKAAIDDNSLAELSGVVKQQAEQIERLKEDNAKLRIANGWNESMEGTK